MEHLLELLLKNLFNIYLANQTSPILLNKYKDVRVNDAKTNATGPLVKIAKPRNNHAEMH